MAYPYYPQNYMQNYPQSYPQIAQTPQPTSDMNWVQGEAGAIMALADMAMAVFFLTKRVHNDILKAYYHIIPFDINCNGETAFITGAVFSLNKLKKDLKSC